MSSYISGGARDESLESDFVIAQISNRARNDDGFAIFLFDDGVAVIHDLRREILRQHRPQQTQQMHEDEKTWRGRIHCFCFIVCNRGNTFYFNERD